MPDSFDEAFPEGIDECVRTLADEPSVDDPEELCGWLREHGFEAIAEASEEVQDILLDLSVEYVSVVDEPAQASEWILAKSASPADSGRTFRWGVENSPLLLKNRHRNDEAETDEEEAEDAPERKVWAAVLVPGEADAQGDLIPEPEIERAAHDYLKNYRKVDEDHNLLDGAGVPIESYIIRGSPETFDLPGGGERTYPEGTWIMGVELSESAWKRVEEGDLTGFSIYGGAASLDPAHLLTEEQAAALKRYRYRRALEKQVPETVLEALNAYFDDHGGDPADVSVAEFVEWALTVAGETAVEVGGVEIAVPEGEETDDDTAGEQPDDQSLFASITMDETELETILGEIRDTTQSIAKSVEDLDDRVSALEAEAESVDKSGDGETNDDVVRKAGPTVGTPSEAGSEGIDIDYAGITEEV